jgi:predicted Zn-dependent protease
MRRFLLVAALLCAALRSAQADDIARLSDIHVHVHSEIADRAFVGPLMARLGRQLAPPIALLETTFDLDRTPSSGGQLDARSLMDQLLVNLPPQTRGPTIHVLLIARDMSASPARFNFAWSFGGPDAERRAIIVSLSRLEADDPDLTAERVAKMIVKNVARTAGHLSTERCVFAFPNSLNDLDATPENYCEPDLSALVAAGVARP